MNEQNALEQLLKLLGGKEKESDRETLQRMVHQLGQFHKNLTEVLKHGEPWQKKLAIQSLKSLQGGLKDKLREACLKEGIDTSELDKFFQDIPEETR